MEKNKFLKDDEMLSSSLNPYCTTYGKAININPILDKLVKLGLTRAMDYNGSYSLSYDLTFGDFIPVVITGKSPEEQEIGPFTLPIMYVNHKDEKCIAVDLREFLSKPNPGMRTYQDLIDNMNRTAGAEFLFLLSSIMAGFYKDGGTSIPFKDAIRSYILVFSTILKNFLALNLEEEDNVKICLATFFYGLIGKTTFEPNQIDKVVDIVKGNANIVTLKYDDIKSVVFSYITESTRASTQSLRTITLLLDYIGSVLPEEKREKLKDSVFISLLSNLWIGPGKSFAGISCVECLPLFLTLAVSCFGDKTFKFSRISAILGKDTRSIDKKNFVFSVKNTYKYI